MRLVITSDTHLPSRARDLPAVLWAAVDRADVVVHAGDWTSEELGSGAYGSSFDLGGLTRFGPRLREPAGPIQIGSSDVAGLGFQHVDGALRVGAEMAQNIINH